MNNQKKTILFFFLFFKVLICFSQIVDGPANFRDRPNGKVLFQLQNGIKITFKDSLNGWYKCVFNGFVEIPQNITDFSFVPKGTKLFSKDLKLAGEILYPIKYLYKGQIYKQKYALVEIVAYTFSKNIKLKSKESNMDKLMWDDSNISDFKYYTSIEEYGGYYISNTINYHDIYISLNNNFERCLIKEKKTQKHSDNSEGIESKIKLEFYPSFFKGDLKSIKEFEIEANNVYFYDDYFISEVLGCCADPNHYTLYSYKSSKPIFSCDNKIFSYKNKNDSIFLFGFNLSDNFNRNIIGKWIIADLHSIIDTLEVIAKDSNIYEMSILYILPNKFYYGEKESESYNFIFNEDMDVRYENTLSDIFFYMRYPGVNDSDVKSKIEITNNRFSTKYLNKTFILGVD